MLLFSLDKEISSLMANFSVYTQNFPGRWFSVVCCSEPESRSKLQCWRGRAGQLTGSKVVLGPAATYVYQIGMRARMKCSEEELVHENEGEGRNNRQQLEGGQ